MPLATLAEIAWVGLQEIRRRLRTIRLNADVQERILELTECLEGLLEAFSSQAPGDALPPQCTNLLEKVQALVKKCEDICKSITEAGTIKKLYCVDDDRGQLLELEAKLSTALSTANLAVGISNIALTVQIRRKLEKQLRDIHTVAANPQAGVYNCPDDNDLKPRAPSAVSEPTVAIEGELLAVRWKDRNNPPQSITRYEVRYDDVNQLSASVEPGSILKLGPPRVRAGQTYTIQVRAVNRSGPGEWSLATVIHFKKGPPSQPSRPSVKQESPTTAIISVMCLTKEEENGSTSTRCIVETRSANSGKWQPNVHNISQCTSLRLRLADLEPDTKYRLRVRMQNEAGTSIPSEEVTFQTNDLIPGAPLELRVSSRRTASSLKVRWKMPFNNPEAVDKFEVQVRQRGDAGQTPCNLTQKLSAKFTQLKSDTKYRFKVRALNKNGQPGEFSEEIEAETLYKKALRAVLAIPAFFGGTVSGPLLGGGAAAVGVYENSSSKKKRKSAAAVVAGTLAGTVFAPVVGGVCAYKTYKGIGILDNESPQTSDDEKEASTFV